MSSPSRRSPASRSGSRTSLVRSPRARRSSPAPARAARRRRPASGEVARQGQQAGLVAQPTGGPGVTRCWTSRSGESPAPPRSRASRPAGPGWRAASRRPPRAPRAPSRSPAARPPARRLRGRGAARRGARDRHRLEVTPGRAHEPLRGSRRGTSRRRVRTRRWCLPVHLPPGGAARFDVDLDRRSQVDATGKHHLVEPAPADGTANRPTSRSQQRGPAALHHASGTSAGSRDHGAAGRAERGRARHERVPAWRRAPDLVLVAARFAGGRGRLRDGHERRPWARA